MVMKVIAFYLPQFHEFEENNKFWGKGFTEWSCLKQCTTIIPNQYIRRPHSDIGEYCLLDRDTRKWQGETAKRYGLYGFCYYHYWFGEKPLMEKPLELMLDDGYPDISFCLSWANEPWTRRMNGGDGEVLIPTDHGGVEEWDRHISYLIKFFRHSNYICIDNKPVLLIYRPSTISRLSDRLSYWHRKTREAGFDGLFLVMTLANHRDNPAQYIELFDAAVEFFPNFLGDSNIISYRIPEANVYEIKKAYQTILDYPQVHTRQFGGMMTGFDSRPRNGKLCNVFANSDPSIFGHYFQRKMGLVTEPYLFVNGWNEWGEGATLEPDERYGYGFLEAVDRELKVKNAKFVL